MKIADINPTRTSWKLGQTKIVSSWTFSDSLNEFNEEIRTVIHYSTVMGIFESREPWGWNFEPVSTGWGSVSDQKAINQMQDDWYFSRKGGTPQFINKFNNEVFPSEYCYDDNMNEK